MNRTENPRKVLGKGLNALLSARTQAPAGRGAAAGRTSRAPRTRRPSRIDAIDANPLQPRRIFQAERLAELAQSIRANGIMQPLVVRRAGDRYQLVAGERRWRAAKLAGLEHVPVVVRDIPDERLLEITLIENIQREDLNPIETAVAFDRLGPGTQPVRRTDRPSHRQRPLHGSELHAAATAAAGHAANGSGAAACRTAMPDAC